MYARHSSVPGHDEHIPGMFHMRWQIEDIYELFIGSFESFGFVLFVTNAVIVPKE